MMDKPEPLSWRSASIILVFGGSLLAVNLGGMGRALSFHEVIFAEPAREMLQTGDWIIPRMLGVPDTHKPPLTSWLLALTMRFLGESEWAVRLPSVLAALATAIWLAFLAARWFGDGVGCLTGLIHVTMYYVLQFGRQAESDIFLVLFVALAMGLFILANVDSPHGRSRSRWLPVAFYLACGFAFMTKGLIGLAFIGSGCGLYSLWNRERNAWRFFFDPIGLALFIVVLLAWPLAAYHAYPQFLDDQIRHHLGRFQGFWGEDEPRYCYLYDIPKCGLPWSPLAAWGIVVGWRAGWARGPLGRFGLCWVIPGTLLLSASQWRHYHYVAPLMPPFAILAAVGLVDMIERRRMVIGRAWWRLPFMANVTLVAGALVALKLPNLRGREAILALLGIAAAGVWLVALVERRRSPAAYFMALFSLAWVLAAGAFAFVIPHYDLYSQQAAFAGKVNNLVPAEEPLLMVHLPEDQLTWYLRRPLGRVDDPERFTETDLAKRSLYLLVGREALSELEQRGQVVVIDQAPMAPQRQERLRALFVRWQPHLDARPVSLPSAHSESGGTP